MTNRMEIAVKLRAAIDELVDDTVTATRLIGGFPKDLYEARDEITRRKIEIEVLIQKLELAVDERKA